jgi:hypothetical protein
VGGMACLMAKRDQDLGYRASIDLFSADLVVYMPPVYEVYVALTSMSNLRLSTLLEGGESLPDSVR